MAKDQNLARSPVRGSGPLRRPAPAVAASAAAAPAERKKRTSLPQFLREVQVEARRVTWTSWKETWITSVMVAIMVVMTAVFFFGIDWVLGLIMQGVLKLAIPSD